MDEKQRMQPQIRRHILTKAASKKLPISGTFELTPRCNFDCRMCYIHMSAADMAALGKQEMTGSEWIALGKRAVENGMLFLLLTGGEPFLRPDFFEIYEAMHKLGVMITINSNGYCIENDIVERLKTMAPTQMHITLYGGSNETYERLCGVKNGFDRVTRNVIALKEAGINVDLNASFTQYNMSDMELIYEFANRNGLRVRATSYMFPPVRNGKNVDNSVRLSAKEAGMARAAYTRLGTDENEFEWIKGQLRCGRAVQLETDDCGLLKDDDVQMHCMAGRGSFWITWDGRMLPCGMMNEPAVDIKNMDFMDAWTIISTELPKIHLPAECVKCKDNKYCQMCGALTTAEGNGDSTKKPEYLCEMTKTFLNILRDEELKG